jgi:hypothetical protein
LTIFSFQGHGDQITKFLANCSTWKEVLLFHGLIEPEVDPVLSFETMFFKYMPESPRYSVVEIVRNCFILKNQNPNFDFPENSDGILVDDFGWNSVLEQLKNFSIIRLLSCEAVRIEQSSPEINEYLQISATAEELIQIELEFHRNRNLITENEQQNEIFMTIENTISHNSEAKRIFVSGQIGTGKNFLINTIKLLCKLHLIPLIATVTTGSAASLIGGRTFHSAFSVHSDINGTKI